MLRRSPTTTRCLLGQFVTRNRRVSLARTLEHSKRLLDVALGGPFRHVLLGAQRGNLFGDRHVDQLVHSHAYEGSHSVDSRLAISVATDKCGRDFTLRPGDIGDTGTTSARGSLLPPSKRRH